MKRTPKKKAEIIFKEHYFDQWCSDTANMTHNQRGIYSLLQRLYFKSAGEESDKGKIATDDWDLLCYRLDCRTQQDREDLVLVLKDKFVIVNKYYRHRAWDKEIKNIRHKMRNDTSKSNGKDDDGNGTGNAHCDKSNADGNANIYTHDVGYAMTNAERQEKYRKLQRLINKGIQADKSMTLDEVRTLFDRHFGTSNGVDNTESNDNGNKHNDTSNAQNRANNYKSVVTNQESKNKESVASVTSQSDACTLTQDFSDFSNSKSISQWQGVSLDVINTQLTKQGFNQTLDQATLFVHLTKFKNYYASREVQGSFLATENVRLDKLIAWIMREKLVFNGTAPASDTIITPPPIIDKTTMFVVGAHYQPCFEGHTPDECTQIIKDFRWVSETSEETYQRIMRVGLENCQKPQYANDEFVDNIFKRLGKAKSCKRAS